MTTVTSFESTLTNGQVTTYTSSVVENVPVVQSTASGSGSSGSSKALKIVGIVFGSLSFIGIFGYIGNVVGAFN